MRPYSNLSAVNTIHLRGNKKQVQRETSFLVVFMSAVVKNVDSLMSTSGRIIHLFSLLLVIHYYEDKKTTPNAIQAFIYWHAVTRACNRLLSILAFHWFLWSVMLAVRSINLAKKTIWNLATRGSLLRFATETGMYNAFYGLLVCNLFKLNLTRSVGKAIFKESLYLAANLKYMECD